MVRIYLAPQNTLCVQKKEKNLFKFFCQKVTNKKMLVKPKTLLKFILKIEQISRKMKENVTKNRKKISLADIKKQYKPVSKHVYVTF